MILRRLSAVLLLVALGATVAPPAPAVPGADEIYSRARTYWVAQRYPTTLDYTIHTTSAIHGHVGERHYTARWSAHDGEMEIHPLSVEEAAHPFHPAGGFTFEGINIGGTGVGVNGDLIGVPLLTPNYTFGIAPYVPPSKKSPQELVAEVRAQFNDESAAKIDALSIAIGPPVIATVHAGHRKYAIALVGVESYGDHHDYHLTLTPLRDPGVNRLRDLWVDTSTYATDKLVSQGNFTTPSLERTPWTVTFADVAGVRYIADEKDHDFEVAFEDIAPAIGVFLPGMAGGSTITEPADTWN